MSNLLFDMLAKADITNFSCSNVQVPKSYKVAGTMSDNLKRLGKLAEDARIAGNTLVEAAQTNERLFHSKIVASSGVLPPDAEQKAYKTKMDALGQQITDAKKLHKRLERIFFDVLVLEFPPAENWESILLCADSKVAYKETSKDQGSGPDDADWDNGDQDSDFKEAQRFSSEIRAILSVLNRVNRSI